MLRTDLSFKDTKIDGNKSLFKLYIEKAAC